MIFFFFWWQIKILQSVQYYDFIGPFYELHSLKNNNNKTPPHLQDGGGSLQQSPATRRQGQPVWNSSLLGRSGWASYSPVGNLSPPLSQALVSHMQEAQAGCVEIPSHTFCLSTPFVVQLIVTIIKFKFIGIFLAPPPSCQMSWSVIVKSVGWRG